VSFTFTTFLINWNVEHYRSDISAQLEKKGITFLREKAKDTTMDNKFLNALQRKGEGHINAVI
jgi:lambda repressor-like predicted transcriptional regulator